MPTDLERLEALLQKAREANRLVFHSYRQMVDALDVMAWLLRKMKKEKAKKETRYWRGWEDSLDKALEVIFDCPDATGAHLHDKVLDELNKARKEAEDVS